MLWYRGTVGPIARVYGPGGASGRPRRRVATRVSILSGIGKKDDLNLKPHNELVKNSITAPISLMRTHTSWGCERSKPRNETQWGVPACRTGTRGGARGGDPKCNVLTRFDAFVLIVTDTDRLTHGVTLMWLY